MYLSQTWFVCCLWWVLQPIEIKVKCQGYWGSSCLNHKKYFASKIHTLWWCVSFSNLICMLLVMSSTSCEKFRSLGQRSTSKGTWTPQGHCVIFNSSCLVLYYGLVIKAVTFQFYENVWIPVLPRDHKNMTKNVEKKNYMYLHTGTTVETLVNEWAKACKNTHQCCFKAHKKCRSDYLTWNPMLSWSVLQMSQLEEMSAGLFEEEVPDSSDDESRDVDRLSVNPPVRREDKKDEKQRKKMKAQRALVSLWWSLDTWCWFCTEESGSASLLKNKSYLNGEEGIPACSTIVKACLGSSFRM